MNMSIKLYFLLVLSILSVGGFADSGRQKPQPFNDREMKNYQARLNAGQLDPERAILSRKTATSLLEEIYTTLIQTSLPSGIDAYRAADSATLPNQAKLLNMARRLSALIQNPELEEVTGIRLSWYRSVGKGMTLLDGLSHDLNKAVNFRNEKAYAAAAQNYNRYINALAKIIENPDRLSAKEVNAAQEKNTARRKLEINYLQKCYELTVELQKKTEKALQGK